MATGHGVKVSGEGVARTDKRMMKVFNFTGFDNKLFPDICDLIIYCR